MANVCELEKPEEGSVTGWLNYAKSGDPDAVSHLCDRYFKRLAEVARARFGASNRVVADEEDIANSVLETLFRNFANGQFPELQDRNDLWSLLLTITNRKVASQIRSNLRQKRGSGHVIAMTDMQGDIHPEIDFSASKYPTHETLSILSDLCNTLVDRLKDPDIQQIAVLKLAGYSNREIAFKLERLPKSIDRKMNIIREQWLTEFFPADAK